MSVPLFPGLLLAAVGLSTSPTIAAQFTVTEALSAPFSNQLTAAPAGARVAWFTDREGRRSVWVAGSHEPARPVTANTLDDGQDIDSIAWSRDGERLAWTRGTGTDGSEHTLAANPAELPGTAELPGPVQQHVEWVDLSEEQRAGRPIVHTIADSGHTPTFTADGKHLLFLRRGSIWIADLSTQTANNQPPEATGSPTAHGGDLQTDNERPASEQVPRPSPDNATVESPAHQLLFVRGSARDLRLSPDGTQLLFTSERGDHSFIAVYTFATRALTWMDPGTGLDHDATWSPDGREIAFIREVPIVSPIADRWMREGAPWSIRVADAQRGTGRELWRADAGPGSLFHPVAARDQLLWTRDGRLLFPWEKDGWTRLYALPSSPTAGAPPHPALLTPGDFEVDMVAALHDSADRLLFSGNRVTNSTIDLDRRHIWSIDLQHADHLIPQTSGTGIETGPALLSDGTEVCMAGGAQHPLVPALLRNGKPVPLAPGLVPSGFPAADFVEPQQVLFAAADGMKVHGQLFLPRGAKPSAHLPAVVFFHGGSRRQMLLGFHPMQYYAQAYEFNQYLVSRGFAVLSVNYRSGTGYGLDFRQAVHYGADGGSEDNDVVGAAKFLQGRPEIDPHRIGAWGGSYGGYLTALALARHSDLYAAGVDLHGVHDWSLELELWRPTDEPGVNQAAIASRAFQSSPMASLDTWKSPVLLMQGDDDRNVLFAQTVRLAAELRSRGVHVEEKVFPDEVHDFLLHRNWITAYQLAAEFLERNLRAR